MFYSWASLSGEKTGNGSGTGNSCSGGKNYLFAGSHEAAQRSAMLYSLLGTCKMHGIEPYAWLHKTLNSIATHPINRIKELLPFTE